MLGRRSETGVSSLTPQASGLKPQVHIPAIKFTFSKTGSGRKHFLSAEDVRVLLSRLPVELWGMLRAVHFNDQARGRRCLGYVTRGHREIAICALPERVSLSSYLTHRSIRPFGAVRGRQWPEIAVRRFMLYDVFLHELGHLQIVLPNAARLRRKFASETKAQEFADYWRTRLWQDRYDHDDPAHNEATHEELAQLLLPAQEMTQPTNGRMGMQAFR